MKFILPTLALVGVASAADFETVKACIYERCPSQAAKCNDSCQAKLEKCADKCGLKVDQVCWGGCVGLFGATTNVALCGANQGCLNQSENDISFEKLGQLIDQLLKREWLFDSPILKLQFWPMPILFENDSF